MEGQNYGTGKGLYELIGFLNSDDWGHIFDTQFEYWKLGEAIEVESKRTGKPLKEVAEKYYKAYFTKKEVMNNEAEKM